MKQRKSTFALMAAAMVLAGCGQGTDEIVSTGPVTPDQETIADAPTSTAANEPATSSAVSGTITTVSDRPIAPDFTLALGTGGSFTLSEGEKPVYLVFWAEW